MASEEKTKSRRAAPRAAAQSPPRQAVPTVQAKEPAIESAWHERAAFQVAFHYSDDSTGQMTWQTRAYREETDDRMVWPGIAGEPLMTWMRERADLPAEPAAEAPPAETQTPSLPAEPAAEAPPAETQTPSLPAAPAADASAAKDHGAMQLTIDQLSLEAALAEQQVGGAPIEPRLEARIGFHLSGVPAYLAIANESSYLIQILAHDPAQNHVAILALEGRQLQPELLEYSAALSFEPPPVGEYQIMALVLLPEQAVSATELGPALTVVAPDAGATP